MSVVTATRLHRFAYSVQVGQVILSLVCVRAGGFTVDLAVSKLADLIVNYRVTHGLVNRARR